MKRTIEIDYVLTGTPTMAELAEFFTQGEEEEYTVPAIKKHLRTPGQKAMLNDLDLTIEDCLNGRYMESQSEAIQAMYADWNKKLGKKCFGWGSF